MIQLQENEHILLLIHKHWFVVARTVIGIVFMLVLLAVILALLPLVGGRFDPALVSSVTGFGLSLYLMILCLFAFFSWMDYYLDMWIVTEKRVMHIDQQGLFSRQIAEIPLASVQDVTLNVTGIVHTLFRFGTIRIQTAGEREFTIDEIPHLQAVKDAILTYAHRQFDTTQQPSAAEQATKISTTESKSITDIPDA
jgi:membrane protein YdbS with pleckstrin-like domain